MLLVGKIVATIMVLGLLITLQLDAPSYVMWAVAALVVILILWTSKKVKK